VSDKPFWLDYTPEPLVFQVALFTLMCVIV